MAKLGRLSNSGLFKTWIGIIRFDEALEMGLMPDFLSGSYVEKNIEILYSECKKRPVLNIVSCFDDRIINRFVHGAFEYYLAKGGADPTLECENEPLSIEMFERVREEILAKPPEDRSGIERFGLIWANAVLAGANAFDPKLVLKIACVDPTETPSNTADLMERPKYLA